MPNRKRKKIKSISWQSIPHKSKTCSKR